MIPSQVQCLDATRHPLSNVERHLHTLMKACRRRDDIIHVATKTCRRPSPQSQVSLCRDDIFRLCTILGFRWRAQPQAGLRRDDIFHVATILCVRLRTQSQAYLRRDDICRLCTILGFRWRAQLQASLRRGEVFHLSTKIDFQSDLLLEPKRLPLVS